MSEAAFFSSCISVIVRARKRNCASDLSTFSTHAEESLALCEYNTFDTESQEHFKKFLRKNFRKIFFRVCCEKNSKLKPRIKIVLIAKANRASHARAHLLFLE